MEKRTFKEKLLAFQTDVDTIKKDATNPHFKNTYASLNNILESVKPILNACGLILTQPIIKNDVCTIITDLTSEESTSSCIPLPSGLTPQQTGSAITYYRRYTLCSLLALEIDEDDDGNQASNTTPTEDKAWLNKYTDKKQTSQTDQWIKVCKALVSGEYTIADIEKKYKLSKELKAELINIQNNG